MSKRIALWDVFELKKGEHPIGALGLSSAGAAWGPLALPDWRAILDSPHLSSAGGFCKDLCRNLDSGAP